MLAAILRQLIRPFKPEKWVFIVGCYNSGTTLLESMLASHPAVSALDEGVSKTDELVMPEELGWTRMWSQVKDQVELGAADQHVDTEKLKKDWAIFFDRRKNVFLEKSIVNSARMTWLQEKFENSYFIFIVRNGYAAAEGIRRKTLLGQWGMQQNFSPSYPIKMCAHQWVINNQVIEQDSEMIKNFRKVYYEDLCDSPQETIEELWNFIGLCNIDNWFTGQTWEIAGSNSLIRNMNAKSFANLSAEDIEGIERVAADMLTFYGYPLLSISCSVNNSGI